MEKFLSKMRQRKVRLQQSAFRDRTSGPLYETSFWHIAMTFLAWLTGLLLISYPVLGDWPQVAARGVALLIIGFGCHMLLRVSSLRERFPHGAWLFLMLMLLLAMADMRLAGVALQRFLGRYGVSLPAGAFVAPHAFVPLLAAMLYGSNVALIVGMMAGVAVALSAGFSLEVFLMALTSTVVVSSEAPSLRYNSQLARVLGRIALWQTPIILVKLLIDQHNYDLKTLAIMVGVMVGALLSWLAISGFAAVGILPFAEKLCGRVSDYTLNRFADLGRPLLRRMALEAPGTYHHSMMVADISQAAAEAIGANGLQARVGAYYHDIGKLGRPQFYVENQVYQKNPHDKLPPNISRMMIINHVKEGVMMARVNRLPSLLVRFIKTHHGTSVIRWFHHKAQKNAAESDYDAEVDESHYRYEGPLPVSKEETIVSLADSVEAAARALAEITPKYIENLVNSICAYKWKDGQLDASKLSNSELASVRNSFIRSLTSLLHGRMAYPEDEKNTSSQSTETKTS